MLVGPNPLHDPAIIAQVVAFMEGAVLLSPSGSCQVNIRIDIKDRRIRSIHPGTERTIRIRDDGEEGPEG